MIKNNNLDNQSHRKLLWTCGWLLTFWSGSMNMIASYAILFTRISHMTGPASDLSRFLVTDARMALFVLLIVISFVFGAYVSAIMASHVKFSVNLMLSTLPAVVSMMLILTRYEFVGNHIFAVLLPMGMGWQNGATSQSDIGRTTHVTGDITDLGLKLAQGDWARATYYGVKFSSFVLGGITGLFLLRFSALLGLATSMFGIVIIGVVIGTIENKKLPKNVKTQRRTTSLELASSSEMNQVTANS